MYWDLFIFNMVFGMLVFCIILYIETEKMTWNIIYWKGVRELSYIGNGSVKKIKFKEAVVNSLPFCTQRH